MSPREHPADGRSPLVDLGGLACPGEAYTGTPERRSFGDDAVVRTGRPTPTVERWRP